LIRDSEIEVTKADLLATDQCELVEQNLNLRFFDTYTRQVPRLRLKTNRNTSYYCISLWSERVYMLNVDGEKIEVPDPNAWNVVLMEERFDLSLFVGLSSSNQLHSKDNRSRQGSASVTRSKHRYEVSYLHSNNSANARCATRSGSPPCHIR
jgi:hypothetical protein